MFEKSLKVNTALAHILVLIGPDSNAILVFLKFALFFGFSVSSIKSPVFPMVTQLPFITAPLALLFPEPLFAKRMTQLRFPSTVRWGAPGPSRLTLSKVPSGTRPGKPDTVERLEASQSFLTRGAERAFVWKAVKALVVYSKQISVRRRWKIVQSLRENCAAQDRKCTSSF